MATTTIPTDLIERARTLGDAAVALVAEAYERGADELRSAAREEALDACRRQRSELAERLVALDARAMAELEGLYEQMSPSPVTAAYFDGATRALDVLSEHLAELQADDGEESAH